MSISTRLEAINQHLLDDYSVLTLAGADLTNVDKNIVNLKQTWKERLLYFMNNGLDVVWENWEKVVGTGTALTLNQTLNAPMKLDLKGNTYQYSTSGKNLINFASPEYVSSSVTNWSFTNDILTISGDGTRQTLRWIITDVYKNSAGKTIKIVCNSLDTSAYSSTTQYIAQMSVYYTDGTSTQYLQMLDTSNVSTERAIPSDVSNIDYVYLSMYSSNSATSSVSTIKFIKPMLICTTSSDTPYEPYTGGIASPNPDYPQDIQVVSGDNTVKVEGKNLFDKNNANILNGYFATSSNDIITSNSSHRTLYINCLPNTTYTIQKSTSGDSLRFGIGTTKETPQVNTQVYQTQYNNNASNLTITTDNNAKYLVVWFYNTNSTISVDDMLDSIQIEYGSSSSTYTPYVSQSYPISLGSIELCKIGDYQDYFYKQNGNWYLYKATNIVTFNGTETWNKSNVSGNVNTQRFRTYYSPPHIENIGYSNLFHIKTESEDIYADTELLQLATNNDNTWVGIQINISRLTENTVEAFKTWLGNNNVTLYYALVTPTTTEITDTDLIGQLNDLEKAKSYNGQTNISQVNDDLASVLNATALEVM